MQKKPAGVAVVVAKVVAKKPAAAEAFFYGWNVELQCGYRCPAVKGKAKDGEEEMACPIEEKAPESDAGELDEHRAHFMDGDTHTVGKTNGEVRALIASLKACGRKTNDVLFSATHPDTAHRLELKENRQQHAARYLRTREDPVWC